MREQAQKDKAKGPGSQGRQLRLQSPGRWNFFLSLRRGRDLQRGTRQGKAGVRAFADTGPAAGGGQNVLAGSAQCDQSRINSWLCIGYVHS